MKNRHVSRNSQRNRKFIENSLWHQRDSEETTSVPVARDSSDLMSKSSSTDPTDLLTSTPVKNQCTEDQSIKPSKQYSADTSQCTPTHSAIDKIHPVSKSITTKKRSNTSAIGHIMKNIGVKGAHHHHHHGKAAAPSTPRLVRTPSAQTSAKTTPQSQTPFASPLGSLPNTLTSTRLTDNSSFTSPRPSSSSSPFIQKFDSNILRTPTLVTPSSPRSSALSPPPPPQLPTLSPSVSQNLMPQLEEDPSSLGEGVTRAIFRALFGADNTISGGSGSAQMSEDTTVVAEQQRMLVPPPRWDDSDEEEDEDDDEHCLGPELSHCKDIDVVDEKWLTDLIKSRSNSRSSSLDLTHRDRERSSPLQSESAAHNVRNGTPLISPAAFEDALKRNLTTTACSSNSVSGSGPIDSIRIAKMPEAVASPLVSKHISAGDNFVPSPLCSTSNSVQLQYNHHPQNQHNTSLEVFSPLKTVVVTTDSILQRYITPTLITQLVLQLPHDDDRLTSPRLSVLKALYKNSPSLRTIITHSLVVAAHCRFLRCEESRLNARRLGSDVNEASLATHCTNITGFDGKPKCNPFSITPKSGIDAPKREECPGTLVRDHDSSLVELTLFILITECTPPAPSPTPSPSQMTHKKTENQRMEGNSNNNNNCGSLCKTTVPSILSQGSYEVVVSIVTNVMRCYGSRLGKSAGSVEQPGILKGVFKIVDILMTNKVDSTSGKAAVHMLLRRLVQRWPRGNHVQEVAYLKLCAHILVHCRPTMTRTAPSTASDNASVRGKTEETEEAPAICLSHVLRHSSRAKDSTGSAIQKTLKKLVECMASAHFKVASQAIQTVMQLNILHPHFISNPNPWSRAPLTLSAHSFTQGGEDEPTAVEALVEVLRENRGHWHPQVRHVSEEALDNLLDYL